MSLPDLTAFDLIVLSTSGGKDSQAMTDYVCELATAAGVRDRVRLVHADLGRSEWPGTLELVEKHAAHYELPLDVVRRPQGDLLTHVEEKGKWPSSQARFCTSDHKRGQIHTVYTKLAADHRAATGRRHTRILECVGLRAQESDARERCTECKDKLPAKRACLVCGGTGLRATLARNVKASNGRRTVTTWLPIHKWTLDEVWARITASGVARHYAYDLGMPRVSCAFCVLATRPALLLAGHALPELLDTYVAIEAKINHRFKNDLSLASVRQAIRDGEPATTGPVASWCM